LVFLEFLLFSFTLFLSFSSFLLFHLLRQHLSLLSLHLPYLLSALVSPKKVTATKAMWRFWTAWRS
jgi:hypothetical protein